MTRLADTPEFRAAWVGIETTREIADRYGNATNTVSKAAKRFGYPPRDAEWGRRRIAFLRAMAQVEQSLPQEAPPLDHQQVMGLADRLCLRGLPGHLAPLLMRARTYADLTAIAADTGQAMQRLLPLWHEVRS